MKTKIVYVLVSSDSDIYLEQAYVSMYSLKHHTPEAHIVVLTDSITDSSFVGKRKEMVSLANEVVVVELDPKMNGQKRSRQLKTSVRNLVEGDFLFIDCDTIVTRPLDEIDSINESIAACRDSHSDFNNNPYRDMCLRQGHLLNWPIDDEKDYFNSGVIYVKDTPETHEFYRLWNENLNKGYEKKVFMDQPSFAKTNYEMQHIVKHLDDVWNCELKHGIRYLKDAYIVHYLCTNPSRYQDKQLFLLNEKDVLLELKRTGLISDEIERVIENPFEGIAETTCCFAGEDLFFLQSSIFVFFRRHFKKNKKTLVLILIFRLLNKIENMCYWCKK